MRRFKLVVAATLTDDQRSMVASFQSRKAALSARDFFRSNNFHADVIYDGPDSAPGSDWIGLKSGDSVNE